MMTEEKRAPLSGIILAAVAATGWGLSGVAAGVIFDRYPAISPAWLTQLRMILAGVILLIGSGMLHQRPFAVLHHRRDALQVAYYGWFGLIPAQYFYFIAVHDGNASVATILQYLGLFFVVFYTAVRFRQLPGRAEWIGIIVAVVGTVLIVTHGRFNGLAVSTSVLFWGMLSAVGSAAYTLIPKRVLPIYGTMNCTGWGLIVSGLTMFIFPSVTQGPTHVDLPLIGLLLFVVLIGTVVTLFLFNAGLKVISATTASLLDSLEPLSAAVFSVWLGVSLTGFDIIGGILIILAVLLISIDFDRLRDRIRRNDRGDE
ncbi:DMT family permease [Secundilactobacillus similis DSM 23365 = JCM 2765]|uniref:DMT family permease n=2 Tax=Secundilactobacillus similis TaxID=414682 RepID=A0A0R2EVS1_9LACO|nr:DMT family permease [Secundilactobacillus similis DSM 23365 = JCM 2765]